MKRDLTPDFMKPSLCQGCHHALIRKGTQFNQETTHCRALSYDHPVQVTYKITECNRFDDGKGPDLYEMKNIAWLILPNRKIGGRTGFMPPSEAKKQERQNLRELGPLGPDVPACPDDDD
jgi:hypothetical protein